MIKQLLNFLLGFFGYKLEKVIKENEIDPLLHNKVENINEKNKMDNHFKYNLINDKKTISKLMPLIINSIDKRNFSLLDIGCGSGVLVDMLRSKFKNADIRGCDFSDVKIKQCNNHYRTNIYFTHDIYSRLNIIKKVDVITCTEVLEHLEHPEKALKNILKALKKNGTIFISVPDGRIDHFEGHINFWSKESFRNFIQKNVNSKKYTKNFLYYYNKNIVIIKSLEVEV